MIIRIAKNKENPYVMMNKTGLNDPRLSFKAKGILAYLLSKPDDWKVRTKDLANHATDGLDAVRSGLKELVEMGYARFERKRDPETKAYTEGTYTIYETPDLNPEKPHRENPDVAQPDVANPTLLINESTNNESTNNNHKGSAVASPLAPTTEKELALFDLVNEERKCKRYKNVTRFPSKACKVRFNECSAQVDITRIRDAITCALQQGVLSLPKIVGYVEAVLKNGRSPRTNRGNGASRGRFEADGRGYETGRFATGLGEPCGSSQVQDGGPDG